MMKRATIIRWTGRGSMQSLVSSVAYRLGSEKVRAEIVRFGNSLAVVEPEPARICSAFELMPGVSWLAVGYLADDLHGLTEAASTLARNYVRRGDRFIVDAEATKGGRESDLGGAITSRILDTVKGARTSLVSPKLRFRAAMDGERGVVGLELARGPGGAPMGEVEVACLVSGGKHSSVLAWNALLMGLRVKLVHANVGEEGLLAVARLYSELSYRVEPRGLRLVVLDSPSAESAIVGFAARAKTKVFAGFTANGEEIPGRLSNSVAAPLYLMPEAAFDSEFASLKLKGAEASMAWGGKKGGGFATRTFGGRTADVSEVLDGLG
jgi:hypothetical protein